MKRYAGAVLKSTYVLSLTLIAVSFFTTPSFGISGTTTTLAIAPDSSVVAGTAVTLTTSVSYAGSLITAGSVTFCNTSAVCPGPGVLGVAQVTGNGTASIKVVLGVGTYNVQAQFNGLNGGRQSNSGQQTLTVTGNSTYLSSTTVTPTGGAGSYTLAATVTAFGRTVPSGTVSFNDASNGNYLLAAAALDPSTLSYSLTPATGSPFNVGVGSYFVATGDFNGDGIPDMAIVDTWNLSIFLGKGDGTFQNPTMSATGVSPEAITVGDFNSDGIQDLAIANYGSNTISILLGNGDGTFQSQVTYAVGNAPESIEAADVNWDGIQDLVVANTNDNDISVLLGNGDGTFQAQSTYPTGNAPHKVAIADFNGDGFPDVVTANAKDSDVTVLLGNGDGTFGTAQTYPVGYNPNSVEAGDFNGDGFPDLVVGNYSVSTVSVLLGNGDGTFQSQVVYATGGTPAQMAVADFNGDNILDVVVANAHDNTVNLLLGKGDGTFQPQVAYPVGNTPVAVAVADFNGDGLLDLATPNFADGAMGTVSILLGQQSITATVSNVNVPGLGTHNVLASYPGDNSRAASQSNTVALAGGPAIATTISLIPSANPVPLGQTVEFTATVNPIPAGASFGTVSFYDGSTLLGSNTINASGIATFTTSSLALGAHTITATYSGNALFAPSTSPVFVETVAKPGLTVTATSLSGSPNPATSSQSVTLVATVNPVPTGTSAGTVSFYDGNTLLAAVSLDASGVATLTTSSLPTGTDIITAVYSGNASFASSTSPAWNETVTKGASNPTVTATALNASPNPAIVGTPVVLTATVKPAPTGASVGTVSFYNGAVILGSAALNSAGVAIYTTNVLPVGTDHLTAVYSGNSTFEGSTSQNLNETVSSSPVFTVTAPQTVTLTAGSSVSVDVTVTPVGGAYGGIVTMSYSELPAGLTATWSSAAVTPKSKSVTTTMTIAPSTSSDTRRNNQSKFPIGSAGMAVGMCLVFGRRKRFEQGLRLLLVCTVLYSGMMLTGCAGGLGTSSTTTSQSQNYQVTITGTSGSLHSSTTVTLIVKQ